MEILALVLWAITEVRPTPSQSPGTIDLERVDLEQAFELLMSGRATFLDARTREEYAKGHIAGAVCLPSEEALDGKVEALSMIAKDRTIVPYCDGGDCEASIELAQLLKESGYSNVLVFEAGWQKWKDALYPTEFPPAVEE